MLGLSYILILGLSAAEPASPQNATSDTSGEIVGDTADTGEGEGDVDAEAETESDADADATGDDSNAASLDEILASDSLPNDEFDLNQEEDAWVLRDTLEHHTAQTLTVNQAINELADDHTPLDFSHWTDFVIDHSIVLRLRRQPHQHLASFRRLKFDIPVIEHPLVDMYIDYFTGRGRWFFENWLSRAERYIPIMQPILEEKGVPKDLVYLAMIESGFVSRAYSTAAASGFWQFIRSTGKTYGLRSDTWVDERRDFILATHAAANYLSELYKLMGDWHLAWASYNAGDGRVRRALAKYGANDFWSLIEHHNSLAKETKHYVPKIIAAAIIAKDRVRYGFTNIKPESPLLYDEIQVTDALDMQVLADKLHVAMPDLHDLNPSLLYDITPPGRTTTIRVPKNRAKEALAYIEALPVTKRITYSQYRVRRGDTLSGIARAHGTSTEVLMHFNKIKSVRSLKVGRDLIVPSFAMVRGNGGPVQQKQASNSRSRTKATKIATPTRSTKKPASSRKPSKRHTVSAGDTLWSIAQRYGVSVNKIKSWNQRRGNRIAIGEVLEIF